MPKQLNHVVKQFKLITLGLFFGGTIVSLNTDQLFTLVFVCGLFCGTTTAMNVAPTQLSEFQPILSIIILALVIFSGKLPSLPSSSLTGTLKYPSLLSLCGATIVISTCLPISSPSLSGFSILPIAPSISMDI